MPDSRAATPPEPPEEGGRDRDPRVVRSRNRLVQAASGLLAEGGVQAVTIDAVTRTAGVARATLYRHFATGTDLLATAFEQLLPPVAPAPDSGPLRQRLVTLLTGQARLLEDAPLYATVLSWLGMDTVPAADDERPGRRRLRRRIVDQYRQPFDAVLTSPDAAAELGDDLDVATALAQLVGPLIFNRLVTHEPVNADFCARIVDDFLTARARHR